MTARSPAGGGGEGRAGMTRLSRSFPSLKRNPLSHPLSKHHLLLTAASASASSSSAEAEAEPTTTTSSPNDKKNKAEEAASSSSPTQRRRRGGAAAAEARRRPSRWCVYLIVSSRLPRTYVGVTTNFPRRLKQHNGELKGGAKASRGGRPWTCACIIQGFKDRSEACEFEARWKSFSRKLPQKQKKEDHVQNALLHHRQAALTRVEGLFDCQRLQIDWLSSFS